MRYFMRGANKLEKQSCETITVTKFRCKICGKVLWLGEIIPHMISEGTFSQFFERVEEKIPSTQST